MWPRGVRVTPLRRSCSLTELLRWCVPAPCPLSRWPRLPTPATRAQPRDQGAYVAALRCAATCQEDPQARFRYVVRAAPPLQLRPTTRCEGQGRMGLSAVHYGSLDLPCRAAPLPSMRAGSRERS